MKNLERRYVPLEMRADDDEPKIRGYAAVFDSFSVPLWGFREKIRKGAFKKSIREDDVRALWNHDPNYVLGRNRSGTLSMTEDDEGLLVEIDPPDAQWARDAVESMRRGDVDQMSFGFTVVKDEWDREDKDDTVRTLVEVRLFDVSPVTYPAYPDTSVAVRDAFSEAGLHYESLAGVLVRARRGLELTDSDRDLITASMDVLTDCLGDSGVSPGEGQEGRVSDLARAKAEALLELIELKEAR